MKRISFSIFLIIISLVDCYSQACCSSGTPLSAQLGLEFLDKGDLHFTLAYDYNVLNDQFGESEQLSDDSRSRISHSVLSRIQYAPGAKWSLALSLPYLFRSEKIENNLSSQTSLNASGIGDLLLQANLTILSRNAHNWLLSSGVKFPSGSNSEENELGIILPSDLQPGTGSYDLIIASLYELNSIADGNLNASFTLSARFNGNASRYDGRQECHFGNAFQSIIGFNYDIYLNKGLIIPSLNLSYRRTLRDEIDEVYAPSTGGDWVNLIPGIAYYRNSIKVFVSSAIPLYRYLEGTQLTSSYRVFIQLQYILKTKKNEVIGNY